MKALLAQLEFIKRQQGKREVEIMEAFHFMYPGYMLDIKDGVAHLFNKTGAYSFPLEEIPDLLKRYNKRWSKAGKLKVKRIYEKL